MRSDDVVDLLRLKLFELVQISGTLLLQLVDGGFIGRD